MHCRYLSLAVCVSALSCGHTVPNHATTSAAPIGDRPSLRSAHGEHTHVLSRNQEIIIAPVTPNSAAQEPHVDCPCTKEDLTQFAEEWLQVGLRVEEIHKICEQQHLQYFSTFASPRSADIFFGCGTLGNPVLVVHLGRNRDQQHLELKEWYVEE